MSKSDLVYSAAVYLSWTALVSLVVICAIFVAQGGDFRESRYLTGQVVAKVPAEDEISFYLTLKMVKSDQDTESVAKTGVIRCSSDSCRGIEMKSEVGLSCRRTPFSYEVLDCSLVREVKAHKGIGLTPVPAVYYEFEPMRVTANQLGDSDE